MEKNRFLIAKPKNKLVRGFTLVELLIAASIFSVIMLSLYSAFQTGILSYNRIDSAFNVYQTARIVLNRIELDLKNSFIYSKADSKFIGNSQTLELYSIVDTFQEGEVSSKASLIKYDLSDGILKRTCYAGLGTLKENPEITGDVLSSDVEELSFQYAYTAANPDKLYDWQDSWPNIDDISKKNEQEKTLPLAVKIKLALIERDRQEKKIGIIEFNKIVSLPLSEKPLSSSSRGGAPVE